MVAASSLTAQEPKLRLQLSTMGKVGKVNCLTISPDGKTLAGSQRGCGTIILWNTETGRKIDTLRSDGSEGTHFLAIQPR